MLSDFSREKSTSTAFTPNGVYDGIIRRVDIDDKTVWVELPRIAKGFEFGPLTVTTIAAPRVGDRVACMFLEDRADDIIVLGVKLDGASPDYTIPITCLSTSLPANPRIGQIAWAEDTAEFFIYDGFTWLLITDLLDSIYVNASGDTMNGTLNIALGSSALVLSSGTGEALIGTQSDSDRLKMVGGILDNVNEGGGVIVHGNTHATFPATVLLTSNGTERLRINSTQAVLTGTQVNLNGTQVNLTGIIALTGATSVTGTLAASSTVVAQDIIQSVVGYRSAGAAASAVAYGFTGDANTGMFSDAADTLRLATNGTARLTISSTGAVTIPGVLNVQDTATFSGSTFARFTGSSVSSSAASINRVDLGVSVGAPRIVLETTGTPLASGGAAVWNIDNFLGTFRFHSNAVERYNFTESAFTTTGSINIVAGGTVQGTRLISTVGTGTSPLTVSSTTAVSNLNADLLDDKQGNTYLYTNHAANIMQRGSANSGAFNGASPSSVTGTITFPRAFSNTPTVVATCSAITGNTATVLNITAVTASDFSFRAGVASGTTTSSVTIWWIAIGAD